jgi:hypothetical protein
MTKEIRPATGDHSKGQAESVARVLTQPPVQDPAALREAEDRMAAKIAGDLARHDASVRGQR